MPQQILVTGGTGLIGTRLTQMLLSKGYQVSYLSRSTEEISGVKVYAWNLDKEYIQDGAIENADYIVHLAGAGVADKRWNKSRKQEILESRTQSTQLLFNCLKQKKHQVKAFISSSAIGYYGYDTGEEIVNEATRPGDDYLAGVVQAWEVSVQKISSLGIRTVSLRLGIVLSEKGGALAKIAQTIKLGAGAPIGTGKQYVSWIHIDDACRTFIKAIEDDQIQGIYNVVAPHPVNNEELTKAAAQVLDKPLILPNVPAFALKLAIGEMAAAVLGGSYVSNKKLENTGFTYSFPQLAPALKDLLLKEEA